MKHLLFFVSIFFCISGFSGVIRVTSTADTGPATLREAVETLAANGDTVLIDVKGDILLGTPLVFDGFSNLTVVGPAPKHCSIKADVGFVGATLFQISNCNSISFIHFGFIGTGFANVRAVTVLNSPGPVFFERILFKNLVSTGTGGAINTTNSTVNFLACSFIGNTALNGGALSFTSGNSLIQNSTFWSNQATNQGGAVYIENSTAINLVHNTIYQNNAVAASTAFASSGATNSVYLEANAIGENGTQNQFSGGGSYSSGGGNIYKRTFAADVPIWGPSGGDADGVSLIFDLRPGILEDGFGLMYFPIVSGTSQLLDVGPPSALQFDVRNAPRVLKSADAGSFNSDAGACEYTPLRVTDVSGNAGTVGSLPWALDFAQNDNPINFIEFDIPGAGPFVISPAAMMSLNGNYMIDGFSQLNSVVPGPGTEGSPGVTPASLLIEIQNTGAISEGLNVAAASTNSRISGLRILAFIDAGIYLAGSGTKIFGCEVGVMPSGTGLGNQGSGIFVDANNNSIGGTAHWQRNVISANATVGGTQSNVFIDLGVTGTQIFGNIIGLRPDGVDFVTGGTTLYGIYNVGGQAQIGMPGAGNLISGMNQSGVICSGCQNMTLQSNTIGLAYDQTTSKSNQTGVFLFGNGSNAIIGGTSTGAGNLISGNISVQLRVDAFSGASISGNYIGPDKTGSTVPVTTTHGIYLADATANNVLIGGAATSSGNVISGNQNGIFVLDVGTGCQILNNIIGLNATGDAALANSVVGIIFQPGVSNTVQVGEPGAGNVISGQALFGSSGVSISGTVSQIFKSNIIGLDVTGTYAISNYIGMSLNTSTNAIIGGDYTSGEGNTISGNTLTGILVDNGCDATTIQGNRIGTDLAGTAAIANGLYGIEVRSTTLTEIGGSAGFRNVISGNSNTGGAGILLNGNGTGTSISGNLIGINATGNGAIPNYDGIQVQGNHEAFIGGSTAQNYITASTNAGILENSTGTCTIDGNYIGLGVGGVSAGLGNYYGVHVTAPNVFIGQSNPTVITNNFTHGIFVEGDGATGVQINNTTIGTNLFSLAGIGNQQDGIRITDADGVLIGNTTGNKIIGNAESGIRLTGSATNAVIQQNTIADLTGSGLTNTNGIYLTAGTAFNTIGGNYGGAGNNTIGNSLAEGILIENSDNNAVYGNRIGNNGNTAFPNQIGIRVLNSNATQIGDEFGKFNVIGGNTGSGIAVENATVTVIAANLVGVNETGNAPLSNYNGIEVLSGSGTLIGGSGNAALGNTISSNLNYGILLESAGTTVMQNKIGPKQDGLGALSFQLYGVVLNPGATGCQIGGDGATEGNLIASNSTGGILIQDTGNEIYGNVIGATMAFGALGTQPIGIEITGVNAASNLIGTAPSGGFDYGNTILNHSISGIRIHSDAHDNLVAGNYIGTSSTDVVSVSQPNGVEILSSAGIDNKIGNDVAGGGNLISGNVTGIKLDGAVHVFIYNNRIGTSNNGLLAQPNTNNGIYLFNAGFNTIGGTGLQSNLISGNTVNGILMEGASSTQNIVAGNIIGATAGLTAPAPNAIGIMLTNGATANFIGQAGSQLGNTISGNSTVGVVLDAATGNTLVNNSIGIPFSNLHGLVLQNGATLNVIGGSPAERNIISNNDSVGVALNNATNNILSGNFIGTNANGNLPLGNVIGIYLGGSDFNEIGNQNQFNLISSNTIAGIIFDSSLSNTVKNNFFGTDSTGNSVFAGCANGIGIAIKNSDSNLIGGNNTIDEENVLCSSINHGIYLENSDLNEIYGNHIGINKAGTTYFPNQLEGIRLRLGSDNNSIGATGSGLSNAIGGNSAGIYLTASNSNQISTNFIGNNLTGTAVLAGTNNQQTGIHIDSASVSNTISESNVISGNLTNGIRISGVNTTGNMVKGNLLGVDAAGSIGLPNGVTNIVLGDSAKLNIIGGDVVLDRNYLGGDMPYQMVIHTDADSNQVEGNYIGLGMDGVTTYNSGVGIWINDNARYNIIGGGSPGKGNTLVGFTGDGIRITEAHNTSILGNRIGILPDSSPGVIANAGIKLEGADYNWIGSYLVGSDSMNTITNCNTGVAVTTISIINSSYGNVIGGNAIYNNTNQGIDLVGDGLVMPIDTNNSNIFIDNGGMDRPEIIAAWDCGINGNTWVGFKFYASNALPNYHIEFYRNPTPDGSGYGEGEIYLGDFVFSPTTNYDTISIDLGQSFPVGTVLTATVTGVLGNTSEFSQQFVVTDPPIPAVPTTVDETCLGAANGSVNWVATDAYSFSTDGGLSWTYVNDVFSTVLPSGIYTLDARYLNGCIQSENVTLNQGLPLPFLYTVVPDTCGLGVGEILIDTTVTNAAGGSGNYIYTFNGGSYFAAAIDTVSILSGTFTIGLSDTVLGCMSNIDPVVVPEITEVEDESFVFTDFCSDATAVPVSVTTPNGAFSFETTPGDGATIDGTTGQITGSVTGNSYSVIYTVGVCAEKDTAIVSALAADDPTFTMTDFCEGSAQNIVVTGLAGGTFSFDPVPGDGAFIDPSTGIIAGFGGATYTVKYVTNGPCPDSTWQTVNVLMAPAAPTIFATDSIYCPGDIPADLTVVAGISTPAWTLGSASGTVVSTSPVYAPASLTTGNNYIFVKLVDASLCESAADSINYYLSDLSGVTAGPDVSACLGSLIQLNAVGGITYAWTANDDLTDLTIADPLATVDDDDLYVVNITDAFECTVTDTVRVTLLPLEECYVETYNAFSPNNDGTNDLWLIDGIEGYPENTVTLFNRWGDVLMRFENYNNTTVVWNGYNTSDKLVDPGTYYFVVDVNGNQNQSGWVQVIH
ncbi:MAG: gliding motility-associated C-terminal domain-containing protein [Bacteroidetes bacterium]|nr:gliding motility-associated C-terminal domain-containing protein [Bacteroidota bacterium]